MKKTLIVDDTPEYVDTIEAYLGDRFDVLKAQSPEKKQKAEFTFNHKQVIHRP